MDKQNDVKNVEKDFMLKILTYYIYGVDFEVFTQPNVFDFNSKQILKISVPKIWELDDDEDDYSPDKVMKTVKETIADYLYSVCETKTDEEKQEVDECYKVLGKVRDEVWTQEKFEQRTKVIQKWWDYIKSENEYKEI